MTHSVKTLTWVYGFVLVLVGIGVLLPQRVFFVSEAYTSYGFFHLLLGLAGFVASRESEAFSRWYLIVVGLAYAFVGFDGLVWGGEMFEGLSLPAASSSYLYFVLGVVGLGTGLSARTLQELRTALKV